MQDQFSYEVHNFEGTVNDLSLKNCASPRRPFDCGFNFIQPRSEELRVHVLARAVFAVCLPECSAFSLDISS